MNIEIRTDGDYSIAKISGEIDSKTSPQAQEELLPVTEKHSRIILDMTDVTFLSSAGLRTLLLLYRQITADKGRIVLVGLTEEIQDTMAMTGFLKFFVIAQSLEEGLKALG